MINIILGIIFLISLSGIIIIFYRKAPFQEKVIPKKPKKDLLKKSQKKFQKYFFSILHKFLSRVRIIILKIERKIDIVIKHLRKSK